MKVHFTEVIKGNMISLILIYIVGCIRQLVKLENILTANQINHILCVNIAMQWEMGRGILKIILK